VAAARRLTDEVSSFSINNLLPDLISSPHGNIRLPAHFFFDTTGAKKKLAKRNALFCGRCPHPQTFEKV